MRYSRSLFVVVLVVCSTASASVVLVRLPSNDFDSTLVYLDSLSACGVTIRHVFPPNAAIVETYALSTGHLMERFRGLIAMDPGNVDSAKVAGDDVAEIAYLALVRPEQRPKAEQSGELSGCIRVPSYKVVAPLADRADRLTGQYLVGSVAVGIYLMESNGQQENWNQTAVNTTVAEIVQGLDLLATTAEIYGIRVSFVYAPVDTVPTVAEPITGNSPDGDNFSWLNDVFNTNGQPDGWDGAYGLANHLRRTYRTNWAVECIVVMDDNDSDHKFADGYFAYTPMYGSSSADRGPFIVMTYNNDGWGPSLMDVVARHEVAHVFGTSDEYTEGSPDDCNDANDCGVKRSYLQTTNGNCAYCNPNSVLCIMRGMSTSAICYYSRLELGWFDDDADGAVDPIDQNYHHYMWLQPVAAGDILLESVSIFV